MGSVIPNLIFLVIIQSQVKPSQSERPLALVTTNSRLPAPTFGHVALYDGHDSIFVTDSGLSSFVVKYSIETGRADTVGNNFNLAGGAAMLEGDEITYFGGTPIVPGAQVFSYSIVTNQWTIVVNSSTSTPMRLVSLAWVAEAGVAYLFGGADEQLRPLDSVCRYNTSNNQLELVAELVFGRYSAGAAWESDHEVAYVFGGSGHGVDQEILKFDPKTSPGYVGPLERRIPVRLPQSCAVYASVDKQIYMTSEGGLLKFDPDTEEIQILEVVGLPERLYEAACTYVPELDRMYILSGRAGPNGEESDMISYVELTTNEPLTPTTDDPPLDLKHILTDTRLPSPTRSAATVYDGQDSIYVLGGYDGTETQTQDNVVKYSLDMETVEFVGTFLPTYEGLAFMLNGNIIHVGGHIANSIFISPDIYNYSIAINSYTIIATIPVHHPIGEPIAVAWDEINQIAYLYVEDSIYLYNPSGDGDVIKVAEMQEHVRTPAAVWYNHQHLHLVYTLGFGSSPGEYRGVMQFNPEDGNVSLTPTILPYALWSPCALLADNIDHQIYAFGRPFENAELVRFDPVSQQAQLVMVEAWPRFLHQASCAYVPRLKRLYILGGFRSYHEETVVITSDISYVHFGPSTTIESTVAAASSFVPDFSTMATRTDSPEGESSRSLVLFLSLVVGGPLLVLLILTCIGVKRYRLKVKDNQRRSKSEQFGRIVTQCLTDEEVKFFREGNAQRTTSRVATDNHKQMLALEDILYNANYEVAKEDLKIDFGVKLGSGHFGIVYKGSVRHWKNTEPVPVAVKTVRPNAPVEYFKALMSELKILAHVSQHEFVASLIGANTKGIQNGELFVAVELCKVSLLQYLRDQQHGYIEALPMATEIDVKDVDLLPLCRWADEIAVGMEFLSGKHVIHGDLAARNVLLSFDLHAKICDFGLARQLADYSYISTHAVNRPWKWIAIESLASLHFSTKSDVWAYGVTLWEIFTLGNVPYPCAAWNLDFLNQLEAGYRLEKPALANPEIYGKMCECWNGKKEDRPTFGELKLFFKNRLNQE